MPPPTNKGDKPKSKIADPHRVNMNTPKGRVSFPYLVSADSGKEFSDDKFKLTLLIPKSTDISKLKAACVEVASKTWPDLYRDDPKRIQMPLKDGDKRSDLDGYAGHWTINPKTRDRPRILDLQCEPLPPEAIYGGCHARAHVTVAPYISTEKVRDGNGNLVVQTMYGVTLYLNGVQFVEDGEKFGGVPAKAMFGDDAAPAASKDSEPEWGN